MQDFETVFSAFAWSAIAGCPGRYVLRGKQYKHTLPNELLGVQQPAQVFITTQASDPVLVLPLTSGGLICYLKSESTYVHTLGNPSGFERKLAKLGVVLKH